MTILGLIIVIVVSVIFNLIIMVRRLNFAKAVGGAVYLDPETNEAYLEMYMPMDDILKLDHVELDVRLLSKGEK